uniref:Phage protein n=1 Tax=Dulem virus 201 TaxID=3145678 RepID=A0AAU8AZC0_9VIRU
MEQEFFKVRKLTAENDKCIITCGNMMASKIKFDTEQEAQEYIESKPYDLIFTLAVAAAKAALSEKEDTNN